MFHVDLAPRPLRWDISVPFLRARIPFSVLQERLCSVHAAGAVPRVWPRLYAVKVKLTITLGPGARLASVHPLHSKASPVFRRMPAKLIHRRRQTVWSSRGEGWGISPARREKISRNEGGL